jgi:hypothetical protein
MMKKKNGRRTNHSSSSMSRKINSAAAARLQGRSVYANAIRSGMAMNKRSNMMMGVRGVKRSGFR